MTEAVKGLDLAALRTWLDAQAPGLIAGELSASLITGGKSNLTYAVTDGTRELVVRRPPLGHVLATAHDMSREHRIMTALAPTAVPVPRTYAVCADDDVIGAPFYVMDKVVGTPYGRASQLEKLGADRVGDICAKLVATLAALHAVDPDDVGLADFGRPEGYLERQVRRWKKQLDSSRSRDLAGIDELSAHLETHVPATSDATIVHGDYRLDNLLVDDGDEITAVLDWEMSTLGDPLTDVALMIAYQQMSLQADSGLVTDAPRAPGYWSPDRVLAAYAQASGRDLSDMGFYLALAYFKLAVILEGIYYRHAHGQTLGDGFAEIGEMIEPLVRAGLSATRQ